MTIKEQIIREIKHNGGKNISRLSRESNISRGSLYKWIKGDGSEMGDGKIDRILSAMDLEAILIRKRK